MRHGVRLVRDEARRVFPDPLSLLIFAVFFIAVTLAAMKRPVYGVCVLIASVPFALYQIVPPTTVTLSKTALAAVALALFTRRGTLAAALDRRAHPFLIAGAAIFAATLLSLAQARYGGAVVRESLKALEYILTFWIAFTAFTLDPDRVLVRKTIVAAVLAVCALALTQEFYGAHSVLLMNGHPTPRIAGPLEGPNQLAGYLDVAFPVLLAFALWERSRTLFLTLAVAAFTDVLTFSRGGAIGAIAGIVAVYAILRRMNATSAAAIAAGTAAGGGVATFWGWAAHTIGLSRFWDLTPSAYAGGVGTRPELWHAALVLWRKHPLLGVGAGNFEREIGATGLNAVHTHANSLYLQSLVEGGIPLLAANLALLVIAIARFAKRAAQSPLAAGAFGASVALAAHQFVDLLVFYPKIGAFWWIVLALGAADSRE